jgi:putative hydrolase of the HAD superfamily
MIKVCMFDMGGVLVRNFMVAPKLLAFLGCSETSFSELPDLFRQALRSHSKGDIAEKELWEIYEKATGSSVVKHEGSLLGKFFEPTLDIPTLEILSELKQQGHRVICGTNVNDSHYTIHHQLHQYDIFDHVYASHLMHRAKPDSSFFQFILQKEQLKPDQLFFTDDMPSNVASAQEQGLISYPYSDASTLRLQLMELGLLQVDNSRQILPNAGSSATVRAHD